MWSSHFGIMRNYLRHLLNELEDEKIQRYKVVHRAKAKIHSYLAWQDEPGKPMGVSITAHVLNPDSPSGIKFLEWLKRLYSVNSQF